jgi:hypothetical protein
MEHYRSLAFTAKGRLFQSTLQTTTVSGPPLQTFWFGNSENPRIGLVVLRRPSIFA